MFKLIYLVSESELILFLEIAEKRNATIIKYLETSSGRFAITFSTNSLQDLFMIGFEFGSCSMSFKTN